MSVPFPKNWSSCKQSTWKLGWEYSKNIIWSWHASLPWLLKAIWVRWNKSQHRSVFVWASVASRLLWMRCFIMVITLMSGVYEGLYVSSTSYTHSWKYPACVMAVSLADLTCPLLTSPIIYADHMMPRFFSSVCFISFMFRWKTKPQSSLWSCSSTL